VVFSDVLVPIHDYPIGRRLQVMTTSFRCKMIEEGNSGIGKFFEYNSTSYHFRFSSATKKRRYTNM
jgi:hypothetical protein